MFPVGISPLKVHAQPLSASVNLGEKNLMLFLQCKRKLLEINLDTYTTEDVDLLRIKAENFDSLMQLIKEKLSTIKTKREIIQVLNLAPETWSVNMLLVKLEVLFRKKGHWLYLTKKERKRISQDTINLIKVFYEDDEFS